MVDVVYLTDLRFPGGSSTSLVEEVVAATAAGYRIAVLHCRSVSLQAERTFQPRIRELIDEGRLLLIRPGEHVDCALAVVKHPTVMVAPMGGRLPLDAKSVIVFAGQVPQDADGTVYYDPRIVQENVSEAFGAAPVWHPVSPVVRMSLRDAGVPMSEIDWVEVIDPEPWSGTRGGARGEVPIIGRHGRPSPLKWPDNPDDLANVYPTDGSAKVRVLGGTDGLDAVLNGVPDDWDVQGFGAMNPVEFLQGVDFFVYFHHRDLIEAFGRTILEALASGCVVILPPHFEDLFGPACLYASPGDVRGIIHRLHLDTDAFLLQSAKGREAVVAEFSHAHHVDRIRRIVGSPGGATGRSTPRSRLPPGFSSQRPKILVSCVGCSPVGVARSWTRVVTQRDHSAGFNAMVISDQPAPLVAAHLDEELVLDRPHKRFVGSRSGVLFLPVDGPETLGEGTWQNRLLGQVQGIVRRHEITSIMVGDPSVDETWLALQVKPMKVEVFD